MAGLDHYPILQVAAAIITFFVSVVLMVRARKANEALPPSASMPEGVQMFMHGPVVAVLETLKAALEILKAIRAGQQEQTEMLRRIEEAAGRARDTLRDTGERTHAETERVRDTLRDTADRSSDQLRSIQSMLAKLLVALRRVRARVPE